jgi:transposase
MNRPNNLELALKIERVLHFASHHLDECPEEFYDDVKFVKEEYRDLKRFWNFDEAAKKARVNWIEKVLKEHEYENH